MAKKKKRKPSPSQTVAGQNAPRPQKRTGPSRSELQHAAHLKAQRQERMRRLGVIAVVVVVGIALLGTAFLLDRRGDAQLRAELTAGSCDVDSDTDPTGPAGQNHVTAATYDVNPPAGGDHLASAARAGIYEGSSTPEDGLLVHSLEHGYVVVWHQPDLPEDQREQLEEFQQQRDEDVIVAERRDLPVPVAATAWGQRLLCQGVEAAPLARFFDEHVGNGPEDVARG